MTAASILVLAFFLVAAGIFCGYLADRSYSRTPPWGVTITAGVAAGLLLIFALVAFIMAMVLLGHRNF